MEWTAAFLLRYACSFLGGAVEYQVAPAAEALDDADELAALEEGRPSAVARVAVLRVRLAYVQSGARPEDAALAALEDASALLAHFWAKTKTA
jgi:hypothetical protein